MVTAPALGLDRTYSSPFSSRYGSARMREVFSEHETRLRMRQVWAALAFAQYKAGIVSKAEYEDIEAHVSEVDISRSLEIEKETGHDVVAEIRCFAGQCKAGGGKIHLGATSEDILGSAQVLQQKAALGIVKEKLILLLGTLGEIIEKNAGKPCMAYTHLQPAEPTTIGYRFAVYAQDLLCDFEAIGQLERSLKGKGFKGAVGTSASYGDLLEGSKAGPLEMEKVAMSRLGLECFEIATQTYPRKQDFVLLSALAQLSQSLAKTAFDIRVLQSPMFGELSEPFGKKQVGSSAMPFKRNPVTCEKICSLARLVQAYPPVALENASDSLLERTLDDSANRRVIIPEAFLALDEMLESAVKVLSGLAIDYGRVARNLDDYSVFSGTERLLAELARRGADRQKMHELIREYSMQAWPEVKKGRGNPLSDLLARDEEINRLVKPVELERLLDASHHTGLAEQKARAMAENIRKKIASSR